MEYNDNQKEFQLAKTVNHGHAVYFEAHNPLTGFTAQFFLISAGVSGTKVVPYQMLSRQISEQNAQMMWRPDNAPTPNPRVTATRDGRLSRIDRPEGAASLAVEEFAFVAGTIEAVAATGSMVTTKPFVIQVSPLDYQDMADRATPKKMIDRMKRVRADLGWRELPTAKGRGTAVTPPASSTPIDAPQRVDIATSASVQTVIDLARSDIANAPLNRTNTIHKDLPELLYLLGGSSISADFFETLDSRVTLKGVLEGQSKREPEDEEIEITEEQREFMRPNGEMYYARDWTGFLDVSVLKMARDKMMFPLLYGPPGTGKTALAEAAFGEELLTIVLTGDTAERDLVGQFIPNPLFGQDGQPEHVWADGPLIKAMEQGRPFLMDEVGLGDAKVLSTVYGAMDGRREIVVAANPSRGTVKAQDGFFIIGSTNPNAPGVQLSEALLSRFTLHVEVTTDYALAVSKMGVPEEITGVSERLNNAMQEGTIDWAPQMRELLAFRDLEKVYGKAFAASNLIAVCPENDREYVQEVLRRAFGQGVFAARI